LKTTLTGSILSNLLLVLGLSLAFGGRNRVYQYFNKVVAHVSANLLSLASTSLLIPTASKLLGQSTPENTTRQSRGASAVLISVYFLYMYYQLWTHRQVFKQKTERAPENTRQTKAKSFLPGKLFMYGIDDRQSQQDARGGERMRAPTKCLAEEIRPRLHLAVALAVYFGSTTLLFFSIESVVESIESLTVTANISRTFVGLILFSIPNCDFAPIAHAVNDQVDIAMNYTIGKCLQTALLITPAVVLLAWSMGVPDVSLVFDGFQVVSLFSAVLMLNFLIITGRAGWLVLGNPLGSRKSGATSNC